MTRKTRPVAGKKGSQRKEPAAATLDALIEEAIIELPLPDPPPEGSEWIHAYRRWARGR